MAGEGLLKAPTKLSTKTKGNPASHRMGNPNNAAQRARCWARGQKAKKARREAQEAQHRANLKLWAEGERTPYQERKRERLVEKYGDKAILR